MKALFQKTFLPRFASACMGLLFLQGTNAWAQASLVQTADTPSSFKSWIGVAAIVACLLLLLVFKKVFEKTDWSLKDALSEEATLTAFTTIITTDPATKVTTSERMPLLSPPLAAGINSTPIVVKEMRASASRLIAFIGMLAIVFLFLGFGLVLMYKFASTGTFAANTAADIVTYLLGGASLFVPYVFNKFSGAIENKT
ncbi:MAG: hypothetical protein RL018_1814 [Pseudomonadota bacterium]|jgi:hypothetical protein